MFLIEGTADPRKHAARAADAARSNRRGRRPAARRHHRLQLRLHAPDPARGPGPLPRPRHPPGRGQHPRAVPPAHAAWRASTSASAAPRTPPASRLPCWIRHDPLGVLLPDAHPLAALSAVPVAALASQPLLLAEEATAPELNQLTAETCRAAGFTPAHNRGTVESIRAAADLVAAGRCLYCVPSSSTAALPGTTWRPLTDPATAYPWSLLWRATDHSPPVQAVNNCAQAITKRLGWLTPASAAVH